MVSSAASVRHLLTCDGNQNFSNQTSVAIKRFYANPPQLVIEM